MWYFFSRLSFNRRFIFDGGSINTFNVLPESKSIYDIIRPEKNVAYSELVRLYFFPREDFAGGKEILPICLIELSGYIPMGFTLRRVYWRITSSSPTKLYSYFVNENLNIQTIAKMQAEQQRITANNGIDLYTMAVSIIV